MSKSTKSPTAETENKGFLELAGEALHVLGHDITEGKDKVVEVAAEKITVFKQAVGKIIHKKKAAKPAKKKTASTKKSPASKKVTAKKNAPATKKAAPKKKALAKKRPTAKKTATAPKKAIAKGRKS